MQELGTIMRAKELQRKIEETVSELRGRSNRNAGSNITSTYQPTNFTRQTHRRKNSKEINRIIAKYSTQSSEADARHDTKHTDTTRTSAGNIQPESSTSQTKPTVLQKRLIETPNKFQSFKRLTETPKTPERLQEPPKRQIKSTEPPPKRPARLKKKKQFNLIGSKSETNLTTMSDSEPVFEQCETFTRNNDLRGSKYNTKSCEDLTEFCDVEYRIRSQQFEEKSILSECYPKSASPTNSYNKFPDILEESYDSNENLTDRQVSRDSFSHSPVFREKPLAFSTPIIASKFRPMTMPMHSLDKVHSDTKSVSGFETCSTYGLEPSELRKGSSEPQLSGEARSGSSQTLGSDMVKKRWRLLKPPFRKGTFDCLLRWRGGRKQQESRIQEGDNRFFEKFGSLLEEAAQKAAKEEATPLAPLPGSNESDGEATIEQQQTQELQSAARDSDSGNETLLDTDSEPDDAEKLDLYENAVGWNIDELYLEILYEILHNVGGRDVGTEVGQLAMLSYVQDAFKVSNDKHNQLLTQAEAKEPPDLLLNVEVIEAKDLVPKDPNGLSDPFVTIYLMSNSSHRYNTSVKSATLNPTWEEHFSLPIPENLCEDSLCMEIWDFDPAETVKEKMTKIFEVKGVKGLRKLMKEIAVTASTGKHDNELIGRANIPLKSIPASGLTMWYSLDKKNKLRRQGVVKIRLNFSSKKNSQVAAQEHRHLLRVLLLHELENSKVAPYWWCGNFSSQAEAILTQHVAQSGLSATDNHLSQWTVYCAIMADHPLSFVLFNNLLDKLTKPIQSGLIGDEERKLFWDATRKLLPVCFGLVRKLRKKTAGDKTVIKNLKDVLKILYRLSTMDAPATIELFPMSLYGWLRRSETELSIHEVLCQGATQGASDWFVHILDNNECKDSSEEGRLRHLIRVIQLVRSDLQRAMEYYDKIFLEMMNFPYAKSLYGLYEGKIASLVEPEVVEVCKSLKRLRYDEKSGSTVTLAGGLNGGTAIGSPQVTDEPLAMGTTLFELYLTLQRFVTLGKGLNETEWHSYDITKFHSWFFAGVAQWLDIAVFKALTRIEKAVELDQLVPVVPTVKYSSSGVDTLSIFHQIKLFWQQLAWPDVEGCYTFVAKIVDDICRCIVFYADKMAARVRSTGTVSSMYESNKFEVTTEWCLAINNIDYVRQALEPFVSELGMDDIIQKMCELRSPIEAQRCKETLQNVIANAIDTVRNKIVELLDIMVKKMMPSITRFLVEGAELLNQNCSSMDRVMLYLEANLDTLYQHLNNENFSRTLDIIWEQLSEILYELIHSNLQKRRPPSFFANLHECLKVMIRSFRQDGKEIYSGETLKRVEYLLKLHGMETRELIHQFHLERWQEQQTLTEQLFGMLTVRAQFIDDNLKLEIMNARNLAPMDSNGLCDSYVRVILMPEDLFAETVKPKTQTHNKNLFPLYDEVFHIPLTAEQRAIKDGLLQLVVKDKDLFSVSNQFIGEAYLHFSEIPATPAPLSSLPQVHLTLTRPNKIDGDAMKALETRQGDKQARDFLKKQKQKTIASSRNFSFSLTS